MLKINKKTEYALIALKHIKEKPAEELCSAKEICELYHTPFDATSRVLQILASKKWLQSEQGAHGGYRLTKSLEDLSMAELCEMIEGPQAIVKCLSEKTGTVKCDLYSSCNMVSPLKQLNIKLIEFLKGVSVNELLSGNSSDVITVLGNLNQLELS